MTRNVMSYSLFGDDPKYCVGAVENVCLTPSNTN